MHLKFIRGGASRTNRMAKSQLRDVRPKRLRCAIYTRKPSEEGLERSVASRISGVAIRYDKLVLNFRFLRNIASHLDFRRGIKPSRQGFESSRGAASGARNAVHLLSRFAAFDSKKCPKLR